jgi:hypothetical protein
MRKIIALVLSFLALTWPAMSVAAWKGKVAAKVTAEAANIIGEAINRIEAGGLSKEKEKLIAKLRKEVAGVAEEHATAEPGISFEYLTGKLTVPASTEVAGVEITGGEVNLYKALRNLATGGAIVKCGLDKECLRQAIHEALQSQSD